MPLLPLLPTTAAAVQTGWNTKLTRDWVEYWSLEYLITYVTAPAKGSKQSRLAKGFKKTLSAHAPALGSEC